MTTILPKARGRWGKVSWGKVIKKSTERRKEGQLREEKKGKDRKEWYWFPELEPYKILSLHKEQEFNCCQTKLKLWNRPFFFLHSNNFSCQFQIARAFLKIIIYKEVNSDRRWVSILKVVGHLKCLQLIGSPLFHSAHLKFQFYSFPRCFNNKKKSKIPS